MRGDLTGTAALTRFILRRDRVRIAVWVASIVLLVVTTAVSVKGLYPTQADLDQAAAASEDSPAVIAFNGPVQALDTVGGQVAFQVGAWGLSMVGLMTLLLVSRWTRGEEESGRLELLRSMAVGRRAPVVAALAVVTAMNVVIGALVAAVLVASDLPVAGSLVFGASFVVLGLVFAGVTGLTSQLTENARVAGGLAGAVLGASFVLRAVGDIGDGTVSWLSPIGWSQKLRPYAGDEWWPVAVPLLATALLAAVAAALASRRDFGGGLIAPRPGPATAAARLGTVTGLALRQQRGLVLWWAVAIALTGVAYGSIVESIEEFIADNEAFAEIIARQAGGSLTDAYLGVSMLILALLTGGYAIQSSLRPRSEETALRAEPVLAGPVSRHRWLAGQLAVTVAGSAAVLAAGGLGMGLTYAAVAGTTDPIGRMLGAALVYLPATWVLVAVAVALHGLVPRASAVAWAVLTFCFVVGFFRELLELPAWVAGLSPFERTPRLPLADFDVVPVAVLLAVAAALIAAGFAGFRRRDLATSG